VAGEFGFQQFVLSADVQVHAARIL
jgi:hypothetical protein